ncbi:MAG TPA: M48 family metallopeptidase [Bacteroidia bacterium]|nr:M48 family metallopeptidase [Bacteroidia bacterium]
MKTKFIFSIAVFVLFYSSCTRVPITGRKQVNLIPESTLNEMSLTEYKKFISSHVVVPKTDSGSVLVTKVGKNISDAIVQYLSSHNQGKRVKDFSWQFNLVQDKEVNAWCMPGGKVVVYTGLLPVSKDENGLAVVLGHEIAHAIARHGNERMSQQLAIQLGGMGLNVALSQKPEQTQQIFMQAYGVSTTLGALAYSRKQESEADKLGLCFMAMAGYDPTNAVTFWERMSKQGNSSNFALLSTHPSDAKRIADIKAFLPTAMKYYVKKPLNTVKGR